MGDGNSKIKDWKHNVTFNDCSQLYADGPAPGQYDLKCLIYVCISLFPALCCVFFLKEIERENRLKRKLSKAQRAKLPKYFRNYFRELPNLSEKIVLINIALGVSHAIICSDIDSWANRISFERLVSFRLRRVTFWCL